MSKKFAIADLLSVMEALRDPETGCPWDKMQTFETIAPYTLEEAYEVADAIARNDIDNLREELGDLLFQVVYHAQMAAESGAFDFHDVAHTITEKMIRRHPHVFGEEKATDESDVNRIWAAQKQKEKEEKVQEAHHEASVLDGVPVNLPALPRCQKISERAAKLGFEWENVDQVLDKVEEEIAELRQALKNEDQENIKEELGDLFFSLTNVGRHLDIDCESALRQANEKFSQRFKLLEGAVRALDKTWDELSLEEMEALWQAQKRKLKKS